MPRFDPSPWNLGLPIGALASACGPVLPLEPMGPTSLGETDPTSPTSDDGGSTGALPCSPACGYGYVCEFGVCVPQGCLEFGCCYGEVCGEEGPQDDGYYGCNAIDQCYGYGAAAEFCDDYQCAPITEPPGCVTPLAFAEVLGPTPGNIFSVFSLAFVQSDDDAARELVIGHDEGAMLVGQGQSAQVLPLPYNGLVEDVAAADFDADGDEDLALLVTSASVELVLLRNDDGAFTGLLPDAPAVFDVHAADLDGDGLPDLVGALDFGSSFHVLGVLPNLAALSFGTPLLLDIDSQPLDLDIGDLDGNGRADVASVNNIGQQVWYGEAPIRNVGGFDWIAQDAAGFYSQMVIADFDGNEFDDLARLVALNGTTLVDAWTTADGTLLETPEWGWFRELGYADAGDVDGDGRDDLVHVSGSVVNMRFGAAAAELFGCSAQLDLPINPYSIAIGDFTGDGAEDIAVQNGTAVQVYAATLPP